MRRVLLVLALAVVMVATLAVSSVAFAATSLEFSPTLVAEFDQKVQSSSSYGWCWDPYYGWYYGWC